MDRSLVCRALGGAVLCSIIAIVPADAHAALDDVLPARASQLVVAGHALRVREHRGIREIAGSDGKVFAIVWRGPFAPPLKKLLGSYAAAYAEALSRRPRGGHGHAVVEAGDLLVETYSHARVVEGSARLLSRMPEGVTIDALR